MSTSPLRWGLLSTAHINRSVMAPLRLSPRNTLVAVASRDAAKARAYAAEWQIAHAFDSYEAMLHSDVIDAVYVSLPNGLHAEWAAKALRAGKHVLCEKPFATTLADVDLMIRAQRETGRVLAEAFMYRHHPQTLKVQELVRSGAIGQVRLVRGSFTFTLVDRTNVRVNPALDGGSIWDVGCYPISYARMIIGEEPVEASAMQAVGDSGVDETFVGTLRFPSGAYAQFDSGFHAPFRTNIEIAGSEGVIVVPRPFKPAGHDTFYIGQASDQLKPVTVEGPPDLYLGEVEDMADAVLDGKAPRITLSDSRANVAAILALLHAAKERKTITISAADQPARASTTGAR